MRSPFRPRLVLQRPRVLAGPVVPHLLLGQGCLEPSRDRGKDAWFFHACGPGQGRDELLAVVARAGRLGLALPHLRFLAASAASCICGEVLAATAAAHIFAEVHEEARRARRGPLAAAAARLTATAVLSDLVQVQLTAGHEEVLHPILIEALHEVFIEVLAYPLARLEGMGQPLHSAHAVDTAVAVHHRTHYSDAQAAVVGFEGGALALALGLHPSSCKEVSATVQGRALGDGLHPCGPRSILDHGYANPVDVARCLAALRLDGSEDVDYVDSSRALPHERPHAVAEAVEEEGGVAHVAPLTAELPTECEELVQQWPPPHVWVQREPTSRA